MTDPVRVGRFEWERLMLVSGLPRPARTTLLTLAVYMSTDGGSARPGLAALMVASGRAKSTLVEHLAEATRAGYLEVVERGGFRRASARATEYAATVPAEVFARREVLLSTPPWARPAPSPTSENLDLRAGDEGPKIQTFDQDEGPETQTFAGDEGPVFEDEGPETARSRSENLDPTTHYHHAPTTTITTTREALDVVVANLHRANPGFAPAGIRAALEAARADGRPPELIAAAARRCFAAPDTRTPARLNAQGPWWNEAATELGRRAPRPAGGGRCQRHATALTGGQCGLCAAEQPEPAVMPARCAHGRFTIRLDGKVPCADCATTTKEQAVTSRPGYPTGETL